MTGIEKYQRHVEQIGFPIEFAHVFSTDDIAKARQTVLDVGSQLWFDISENYVVGLHDELINEDFVKLKL